MQNDELATLQMPLQKNQEGRHIKWTTDVNVILITFHNEERVHGRAFMKTVKEQ